MPAVSRLSIAPVKGLALSHPEEVVLTATGVATNRRFFLVDERGKLFSGIRYGALVRVRADYDADRELLALRFPDGREVRGRVELGDAKVTAFWDRPVRGRYVEGAWNVALSRYAGRPVRLVHADDPGGGFDLHPVSLLGDASVEELARRAGRDRVDERRFRMLVAIGGTEPHEEDLWIGRQLRVGGAVVRVVKPNARCATTTQSPESGARDFDALRAIREYRGLRDGRKIDFGVYADVTQPGRVRVGDPIEVL